MEFLERKKAEPCIAFVMVFQRVLIVVFLSVNSGAGINAVFEAKYHKEKVENRESIV